MMRSIVILGVLSFLIVPYFPVGFWPVPATGSMEPTLTGCDVVVYSPTDDIEIGDVAIFEAEWRSGATLHRAVDETPEGYVFQGDAKREPDPMTITEERILVEVEYTIRSGPVIGDICEPVMDAALDGYYYAREWI